MNGQIQPYAAGRPCLKKGPSKSSTLREGVSKVLICYPRSKDERQRHSNTREGSQGASRTARLLRSRPGKCAPGHDAARPATGLRSTGPRRARAHRAPGHLDALGLEVRCVACVARGQEPTQKIARKPLNRRTRLKRLVRRTMGLSHTTPLPDLGRGLLSHRYECGVALSPGINTFETPSMKLLD